jgi:hypothetical protein
MHMVGDIPGGLHILMNEAVSLHLYCHSTSTSKILSHGVFTVCFAFTTRHLKAVESHRMPRQSDFLRFRQAFCFLSDIINFAVMDVHTLPNADHTRVLAAENAAKVAIPKEDDLRRLFEARKKVIVPDTTKGTAAEARIRARQELHQVSIHQIHRTTG